MVILIFFYKSYISLLCSFINYKRDVKFVNKFIFTLLNEEMTKIKVIDLQKLNNFVVENFLI